MGVVKHVGWAETSCWMAETSWWVGWDIMMGGLRHLGGWAETSWWVVATARVGGFWESLHVVDVPSTFTNLTYHVPVSFCTCMLKFLLHLRGVVVSMTYENTTPVAFYSYLIYGTSQSVSCNINWNCNASLSTYLSIISEYMWSIFIWLLEFIQCYGYYNTWKFEHPLK